MSNSGKRRRLVTATLVVALGAAVFVNWYYTRSSDNLSAPEDNESEYVQNLGEAKYVNAQAVTKGAAEDAFAEIKLNREKARDEALEELKSALKNAKSGTKTAEKVSESVEKYSASIKEEGDIEALISAKLSISSVAVINGKKANIIVEKGKLNDESVLVITDIVTSNSGVLPENIKISEAE